MSSLIPKPPHPQLGTTATATNQAPPANSSRYESQKRRDWYTFVQYLRSHYQPPLSPCECSGAEIINFLGYLDQFGKTTIHCPTCPFFGLSSPPTPCSCPLRQAWGSLDSLVGRLRAAYDEHHPDTLSSDNPFATHVVRLYLHELRDWQSKARGVSYQKKKKKKKPLRSPEEAETAASSSAVELPLLTLLPPPAGVDGQFYW